MNNCEVFMNVSELIKLLSKFDPNLEVVVPHEDGNDYVEEVFDVYEILINEDDGTWVLDEMTELDSEYTKYYNKKVLRVG